MLPLKPVIGQWVIHFAFNGKPEWILLFGCRQSLIAGNQQGPQKLKRMKLILHLSIR